MKQARIIGLIGVVVLAVAVTPVLAETAQTVFNKLTANQITLKGDSSFIKHKGSDPVTIKDNLKVKGNINLIPGATVDGKDISEGYDNVIVVAKSGGDFTTISDAMASITDAAFANRYLVWVAPGYYYERVTMADYTELRGSTRDGVWIASGDATGTAAGIVAATGSIVSDLTLTADGTGDVSDIYVPANKDLEVNNVIAYLSDIAGNTARTIYNDGGTVTVNDSYISSGASAETSNSIYTIGNLTVNNSRIETSNLNMNTTIAGIQVAGTQNTVKIKNSTSTVYGSNSATGAETCYALYVTGTSADTTIEGSALNANYCDGTTYAARLESGSTTQAYSSRFISDDAQSILAQSVYFAGADALIDGGVSNSGSTVVCANSYDQGFAEADTHCQF